MVIRTKVFKLLIAGVTALGVSSLTSQPIWAQNNNIFTPLPQNNNKFTPLPQNNNIFTPLPQNNNKFTPLPQNNNNPNSVNGIGNIVNYPSFTRIYPNGTINTPRGNMIYPATKINNSNGSTTYYYQNGTRITVEKNAVNLSGRFLQPGIVNGGLPLVSPITTPVEKFPPSPGLRRNR